MPPLQAVPEAAKDTDLFDAYFAYVEDTEPPKIFHRWALISSLGAMLGRNFYLEHGHWTIYPNIYTMLIGSPGSRKSTAIKMVKKLIQGAGYDTIAADKVTKEKFLVDLDGTHSSSDGDNTTSDGLDRKTAENLWGIESCDDPRECFIMADEFNDFLGFHNIDFISLLGVLWDYEGVYESKTKHGKSVRIPAPTISILGGNTQANFAMAFPPEIIGQGFLSRLILIQGDQTDRRITFPKKPDPAETAALISYFQKVRSKAQGQATLSALAEEVLDDIYQQWTDLDDVRFKHYSTRRFTQLLKLSLIIAAARISCTIDAEDVVKANTILAAAEHRMPAALGEFGKGKNSDTAQTVLELLSATDVPMSAKDLWKAVSKDFNKISDLATLLQGMVESEKLVHVPGRGFLARAKKTRKQVHVQFNLLTDEERMGLG